jgi:endoglucanase
MMIPSVFVLNRHLAVIGMTLLFQVVSFVSPASAAGESTAIRLNTVGYLPGAEKQASIAVPCTNFTVVRLPDNTAVFSGKTTGPVPNPDTQEQLYIADFSPVKQAGEYQLKVPGIGRSAPFRVAPYIYREPFRTAMLGFYLWRCGTAVSATYDGMTYVHAACHTNDAWLDFVGGGHTHKDGTKGWHDAGDYNKYTVNAGVTVGVMFRAWEDFGPQIRKIHLAIPEAGGGLPDYLAEIKRELDWLFTMQAPDGSVYHKLSTKSFGGFIPPEFETAERYFTPWGSEATANFVGIMAQAARIYRPYDPPFAARCLKAAQKSCQFLQVHPGYHKADQSGFTTGPYEVNEPSHRLNDIPENRLWSAAEIWETTGDSEALRDVENRIRTVQGKVDSDFDWDEVKDLGMLTYLFSERPGRDPNLVELVRSNLLAAANGIVETSRHHGYARPLGTVYYWGCNGGVARQAVILMAAARVTEQNTSEPSSRNVYRATCLAALNYLFGRNYYGRSFVTGLGFDPPQYPHDRRDTGAYLDHPWPGYLVGGPHPKATDWQDVQANYRVNEIAINWNAALVYALAVGLNN